MNALQILEWLVSLVSGGQTSVVQLRAAISHITLENRDEFYAALVASEFRDQITDAWARNGLIPVVLPEGAESPLTLTDDQKEYKYPEQANEFLSKAFGAVADAPGADLIADEVAKGSVILPSLVDPVDPLAVPAVDPGHSHKSGKIKG
jgi:hypothetical protein